MRLAILALLVIALLALLDRLLLAAENRGWIYYRKRKASPGTRASAALELQSILEPDRRGSIEAVEREAPEEDESGGTPRPGGNTSRRSSS